MFEIYTLPHTITIAINISHTATEACQPRDLLLYRRLRAGHIGGLEQAI